MADEWKSTPITSDTDEINPANTDDNANNTSTSASWQTSSQTASANEWPSSTSASDSMSDNRWNSSGAGNMDSETGDSSNISGDLTPETASDMASVTGSSEMYSSAGNSAYSGSAMATSNGDGTSPSLKDQAAQKGHELLEKGKETAGQAIDRAKSQVKTQLSEQKDRATDTLASATEALKGTSQHFRDQNLGIVADYAESFAGQVRKVSDYLREKDLDEVGRDVGSFARQNPALFIGGAFLLGVAVARFLRSSESGSPLDAFSRNTALAPMGPSAMTTRTDMDQDAFGKRPLSAHDYVPGYGVSSSPSASA